MASKQDSRSNRAALIAALVLAASLLVAMALGSSDASGRSASVLGATKNVHKPQCPKECQVVGHVTGFQMRTKDQRAMYKARKDGKIVAWSVKQGGAPDDKTRAFFEEHLSDETFDRYGGDPVGGISILKKVGRGRFKLTKSSPIVELESTLGEKPIFTLRKPLRIQKGRIVAFTTPTWDTSFAVLDSGRKAANKTRWRASRRPDRCNLEDRNDDGDTDDPGEERNLTSRSKPHTKKGSKKRYGCIYSGAQLLYWAYFVADRKDSGNKK